MRQTVTAHTADLAASDLAAARRLMQQVFPDDFSDTDWANSLGGMHVLVWDGGDLVGHGSVVARRLLHAGQALRTGYVEGVGVRADHRGRGIGATVLTQIERIIRGGYALGALSTTDDALGFYANRGWQRWPGPTAVLGPHGVARTDGDDGSVLVLPVTARLVPTELLICDWRHGEVW